MAKEGFKSLFQAIQTLKLGDAEKAKAIVPSDHTKEYLLSIITFMRSNSPSQDTMTALRQLEQRVHFAFDNSLVETEDGKVYKIVGIADEVFTK